MGKVYVYSTLSADVVYPVTEQRGNELPTTIRSTLIRGKAGVADKRLFTPLGAVTEVTESQLKDLEANDVFKLHVQNGFIKVDKKKVDVEAASHDMGSDDGSRPMNPGSFADIQAEGQQVKVAGTEDAPVETGKGGKRNKK